MKTEFGELSNNKIIFLTIDKPGYSRSWNYYCGIRKLGVRARFINFNSKRLFREYLKLRKTCTRNDIFVVMSPSHYLTIYTRLFLGKNIVLDAGWSLFEATVCVRKIYGYFGYIFLKTYLVDFLSSRLASKVILESKHQQDFYCKLLLLSRKKTYVLPTGIDEKIFIQTENVIEPPNFFNNSKIVLFRGKYNRESGIETLAMASNLLVSDDITFWIFCPGLPEIVKFSRYSYVNKNYIESNIFIQNIYSSAQVTIGQLSSHKRLNRTIPHKAFESALFSKCYVTARRSGIKELFLEDEEIICIAPSDPIDLANKIKNLFENPEHMINIGKKMNLKYKEHYSQQILADSFLKILSIRN